ncbi:hypothetical protein AAIR98_001363 [Elusimicrobium simillimum]|uniref:DUF2924 domain-containing protein n=1 Tax=Elusimicrobium simillimum TaxID=3143438 RepID=UPI003C6F4DAC
MRSKMVLPNSFEKLGKLKYEDLCVLWRRYYDSESRAKSSMLRPLWYKIQCENFNMRLDQKYITRLNKYANNPEEYIQRANKSKYNLSSGTEIIKQYLGQEHKLTVKGEKEFVYKEQSYRTLSAVAKAICGKKVSGPDFFNIVKQL